MFRSWPLQSSPQQPLTLHHGYRLYVRKPAGANGAACTKACERPSSRARLLLWVGLGILLLVIAFPRLALYYAG